MPNTNNDRNTSTGDHRSATSDQDRTDDHDTAGNKPVQHVRRGGVQAAIWKNTGRRGSYFAVTFERRYKDEHDEWRTSHAFGRDQLLVLAKVAEVAFHAIHELQREERPSARGSASSGRTNAGASQRARSSR
ncbi:MAG: hypothetical protein IT434_12905 [Phycisphaerales bacterium]|nr:hypothetical protein [Phycisphaerales bacterium]